MDAKIQKWGNSLAVRIPKAFAEQMGLNENSAVKLVLEDDHLIIAPVRRYELDDLLAGITPDNLHEETDWGAPAGDEVW